MSRFVRLCSVALAALGLASCGELAAQLQSEDFAVATLVKAPDQKNPQTGETVTGLVAFQLFFGQVEKSKIVAGLDGKPSALAGAFTGRAGATVKLQFKDPARGETELKAADKGEGRYELDSVRDSALLTYSPTDYVAQVAFGGKTYRLKVTAPEPDGVQEFASRPDGVIRDHKAGADLSVTRLRPAGPSKNPIAFAALANLAGAAASPGWTNAPRDALGFLTLALDDSQWRVDAFKVPGAQFQPGNAYLVTLTSFASGGSEAGAPALFVGSTFLAGVAAGGGVLAVK